jgi:HemY protein
MLIEAWRRNPAPTLAAAYAAIEPDETAHERRLRFGKLLNAKANHPESQLLAAELALVTEDWPAARKAIEGLKEAEPTTRSCIIMAAIARGEGAPEAEVRGWLARALDAPRGDALDSDISHTAMLPLLIGGDDEAATEEAEEIDSADDAETPPDEADRPQSAA